MSRFLFLVFLIGLVVLGIGAVVLGTAPLPPPTQAVERVIPNDRLGR